MINRVKSNPSEMNMLVVDSITKHYKGDSRTPAVLDNTGFMIEQGQVAALVGASGSGKTTLLNLVSGIDRPDSGNILLDDTRINKLGEPELTLWRRKNLGFVFQFFNLIPTLTVAENIALPLELTGSDRISSRVSELLERVQLDGMSTRYPDTLSGGEQQRAAIARALSHQPGLLLADEPTGNLDETTGDMVLEMLLTVAREHATTMLIVTHSKALADSADKVFRLHNGKVTSC